jgi:bifunctional DNA-binding transcriptional regulator/antitoxin component of YhaV-PrlF toxin-antitoxin module
MKLINLAKFMIYTLKLFNTGQITLPKIWRDRFDTDHFIAEEKDDGLLIKPLQHYDEGQDAVYYETKDERGLHFPKGIDPQVLIDKIKKIHG